MDTLEQLEEDLARLRVQVRGAARAGDRAEADRLRTALQDAEMAWEAALAAGTPRAPAAARAGARVPLREKVHQALAVLGAPASPRLICAVNQALYGGGELEITSLRRDEERSYTARPQGRAYVVCAALAHEDFTAMRGLLALSTWPLERRIIAPSSPRVDALVRAAGIAGHLQRRQEAGQQVSPAARRLLRDAALAVPGTHPGNPAPAAVLAAAHTELAAVRPADDAQRTDAASRALVLPAVQQLFGTPRT